jgi:hypothetical protein
LAKQLQRRRYLEVDQSETRMACGEKVFANSAAWPNESKLGRKHPLKVLYKVCQLFAHGWWFSPGAPSSSTTKTGRHDLAEILLKVVRSPLLSQTFQCGHLY